MYRQEAEYKTGYLEVNNVQLLAQIIKQESKLFCNHLC